MANLPDNRALLDWVEECRALMTPDEVEWIDASEEQLERLRTKGVATGEMHRLNPELLPGCYYHRSHPTDGARVEDRTFICTTDPAEAGPTNNHMTPEEAKAQCGFELDVSRAVRMPPPSPEIIRIIREELDPDHVFIPISKEEA